MCDYSLQHVASRPARVGDKLVTTEFAKSITRGFSAIGEPEVAVCLLPGTEVAFDDDVQYERLLNLFGSARVNHRVARFRQVNMNDPHVHHDALEFPDGQTVKVTRLVADQTATVLQLPAAAQRQDRKTARRQALARSTLKHPTRNDRAKPSGAPRLRIVSRLVRSAPFSVPRPLPS